MMWVPDTLLKRDQNCVGLNILEYLSMERRNRCAYLSLLSGRFRLSTESRDKVELLMIYEYDSRRYIPYLI